MLHHPFGPSRLYRLALCPGAHLLEQALKPPDKPTPEAEEGIWLHSLLARHFRHGSFRLGEIDDPELTPEQEDLLRLCIGYAETCKEETGDTKIFPELCLTLYDTDDSIVNFGTVDLLLLGSTGLAQISNIIDWKFGRIPPNTDALSVQLGAYAAMRMGQAIAEKQPMDACYVCAYYPRLNRDYRYRYAPGDFYHLRAGIRAVIDRAKKMPMQLNPSPEACEYCPCLAQCPAAQATAWAIVPEESAKAPDLTALEPAELGKLKGKVQYALGQLEALKSSVNAEIQERWRGGEGTPGWGVRTRRGRRKITNPQAAFDRIGLHIRDFMRAVTVSPATLEEEYIKLERSIPDADGTRPTVKALKGRFEEKMGDCIERTKDITVVQKEAT